MKSLRLLLGIAALCSLSSCAVSKDQFAHAVLKGNVQAAATYHEPGFANNRFYPSDAPGKYALPIQFAILQKNKPMAKFLLDHGSVRSLNGKNLAYYCAYNGKSEMANYFASVGAGSYSDIAKARRDLAIRREEEAKSALIAMRVLGAIFAGMASSGGSGGGYDEDVAARETQAMYRSASNPAGY